MCCALAASTTICGSLFGNGSSQSSCVFKPPDAAVHSKDQPCLTCFSAAKGAIERFSPSPSPPGGSARTLVVRNRPMPAATSRSRLKRTFVISLPFRVPSLEGERTRARPARALGPAAGPRYRASHEGPARFTAAPEARPDRRRGGRRGASGHRPGAPLHEYRRAAEGDLRARTGARHARAGAEAALAGRSPSDPRGRPPLRPHRGRGEGSRRRLRPVDRDPQRRGHPGAVGPRREPDLPLPGVQAWRPDRRVLRERRDGAALPARSKPQGRTVWRGRRAEGSRRGAGAALARRLLPATRDARHGRRPAGVGPGAEGSRDRAAPDRALAARAPRDVLPDRAPSNRARPEELDGGACGGAPVRPRPGVAAAAAASRPRELSRFERPAGVGSGLHGGLFLAQPLRDGAAFRALAQAGEGAPKGAAEAAPDRLAQRACRAPVAPFRSEEHTSELQSRPHLVCRLLLEKKKKHTHDHPSIKKKRNCYSNI